MLAEDSDEGREWIHIEGTTSVAGPEGGSAVVISQVTVENSSICLKIDNSHDIVVEGCYFEPDAAREQLALSKYTPGILPAQTA